MPENEAKYLPPFFALMAILKSNGFLFGMDSYQRVAAYWHLVENEKVLPIETLKAHLSALLCRSEEQQLLFGALFEQFLPNHLLNIAKKTVSAPPKITLPKNEIASTSNDEKTDEAPAVDTVKPTTEPTSNTKIRLAPVLPRLSFPEEHLRVWNLAEMAASLVPLQEKVWTETTEWDVPMSIRSIIRAGGFPRLVFRKRKQAPRYLALIEQKNSKDHLAGYAAELIKEINHRDLEADYYFFDKNPAHCWKELREPSTHINIELLKSEWNGARLLLMGQASNFINPETGMPSNFALDLPNDFSHVALLSTTANLGWSTPEHSLQHFMPVLPMTVDGLAKLMASWNGTNLTSLEDWQIMQPELLPPKVLNTEQPKPFDTVMIEVYRYLGDDAFKWLCACAVYPELYFELTCILHDEAIPLAENLSQWQRNEKWNKALRLLSRLDWFRLGFMPRRFAKEFKKNLTPADLLLVEGEIKRILAISKNQVSDQSYAAELRNELFDWFASQSFRVLWIDDRPQNNQQYRDSWSKTLGIHFKLATTSSEALGYLNNERFDLVLSDLGRPGEEHTGQITLDIVAKRAPVVFFTNERGLNLRGTLLRAGAKEVTDSVGVLSVLVREELRKKFPLMEQVPEVPDLDLSGLENVVVQEKKGKAPQKKATKKAQPAVNEQVRKDQEMLQKLGFFEGEVDGIAGEKTRAAVAAFQQSAGLVADGILGPQTRAAMERALGQMEAEINPEIPELWRNLSHSVCRIVSSSGKQGYGWIGEDGYITTAKSVLTNAEEARFAKVYFMNSGGSQPYIFDLDSNDFLAGDKPEDFVRVRLMDTNQSTFTNLPTLKVNTNIPGTGDKVSVIYFKSTDNLSPVFALNCPIVQFSNIDFSYEAKTTGSIIGTPALDENGNVIGITTTDEGLIKRGILLASMLMQDENPIQSIREMIANAEIEKAFDKARRIWPSRPKLTLLAGNYSKLQKDNLSGIIAHEDYQRQSNQITNGFLNLLEELEYGNDTSNRKGFLYYEIPTAMPMDIGFNCRVRIATSQGALLDSIEQTDNSVIEEINITDIMRVDLVSKEENGFDIKAVNTDEQTLGNQGAEWIFIIKPISSGDLTLVLNINEKTNDKVPYRLTSFEQEIYVRPPRNTSQSYK